MSETVQEVVENKSKKNDLPVLKGFNTLDIRKLDFNKDSYAIDLHWAKTWASEVFENSRFKEEAIKWAPETFNKELLEFAPEYYFLVAGKIALFANNGANLAKDTINWALSKLKEAEKAGQAIKSEKDEADAKTKIKQTYQISSERRLAIELGTMADAIEILVEKRLHESETNAIVNLLNRYKTTANLASNLESKFSAQLNEIKLAKTDEFWKEAYSRIPSKTMKQMQNDLEMVVNQIQMYSATLKTGTKGTRKVRGKLAVKLEKATKNLNYKVSDKDLGFTSIEPKQIIGVSQLLGYDTKKKRVFFFTAEEGKTLDFKGTTLQNFDATKVFCKTLRKPSEQLKLLMNATTSRRISIVFNENIRGKNYEHSGRINDSILLLKVFK